MCFTERASKSPTSRLGHWGCSSGCRCLAEADEAFRDPWRAFQQQQWDIQRDWRDGGQGQGHRHQMGHSLSERQECM